VDPRHGGLSRIGVRLVGRDHLRRDRGPRIDDAFADQRDFRIPVRLESPDLFPEVAVVGLDATLEGGAMRARTSGQAGAARVGRYTRPGRAAITVLALVSSAFGATPISPVAAQPSPSSMGLTSADVPGFSAVDPSVTSYQNPDDDFVKAWRACAAGDPLLSQLDSGQAATVSPVFGQGSDGYGAPQFEVASIVFDASSSVQGGAAFAFLAANGFGSCIARTADANNSAEGFTPTQPSTAEAVACPNLGAQCTAFDVHEVSSLGTGDLTVSGLYEGSAVTVLVTNGVNGAFPDSVRQNLLRVLAARMGTSPAGQATKGSCQLAIGRSTVTALTTAQGASAMGETVSFGGEQNATMAGGIPTHICTWNGPPLNGAGLIGNDSLMLTISDPSSQVGARFAEDEQLSRQDFAHQGFAVAEVGDAAFFSGAQDAEQSLEVLTGERVFVLGLRRADAGQPAAQSVELTLAGYVLAALKLLQSLHPAIPPEAPIVCDLSRPGDVGAGVSAARQAIGAGALDDPGRLVDPIAGALLGPEDPNAGAAGSQYHGDGFWLAGFFDTVAARNADVRSAPDLLTDVLRAYGEASLNEGSYKVEHLDYPDFYASLDCALSSGATSAALSRDLLVQRDFLGLGAANNDNLVVGLVADPAACLGLVEHLAAAELLSDFGTHTSWIDPTAFTVIARLALSSAGPAGTPSQLGGIVPPPYGPWDTGALSPSQAEVLLRAADATKQGNQAMISASQALIAAQMAAMVPQSAGAAVVNGYTVWAQKSAALVLATAVPTAALWANGFAPVDAPSYSSPGSGRPPDVPGWVGATEFGDLGVTAATDTAIKDFAKYLWTIGHGSGAVSAGQYLEGYLNQAEGEVFVALEAQNRVVAPGTGGQAGPADHSVGTEFAPVYVLKVPPGDLIASPDGTVTDLTARALVDSITAAYNGLLLPADLTGTEVNLSNRAAPPVVDASGYAVLVHGAGFAPHTTVTVEGHSSPTGLAQAETDANGAFSVPVSVYQQLSPGRHELIATGLGPGGRPRSLSTAVRIETLASALAQQRRSRHSPAPFLAAVAAAVALGIIGASLAVARRRRHREPPGARPSTGGAGPSGDETPLGAR